MVSEPLMHALSHHKGLVESFFSFIFPLSALWIVNLYNLGWHVTSFLIPVGTYDTWSNDGTVPGRYFGKTSACCWISIQTCRDFGLTISSGWATSTLHDFIFPPFLTFFDRKNKPRCLWHNLCGSSGVKSDSFAMIHEASTVVLTLIIKHVA